MAGPVARGVAVVCGEAETLGGKVDADTEEAASAGFEVPRPGPRAEEGRRVAGVEVGGPGVEEGHVLGGVVVSGGPTVTAVREREEGEEEEGEVDEVEEEEGAGEVEEVEEREGVDPVGVGEGRSVEVLAPSPESAATVIYDQLTTAKGPRRPI